MRPFNPYEPPAVLDSAPSVRPSVGDSAVPDQIIRLMQQTKPWVTFLGILGFIASGLLVLGGLAVMGSVAKGHLSPSFGLVYVLMAVLYIFPSLLLYRYGAAIKRLVDGGGIDALTEALGRQKSFWRLIGIAVAAILALYGLVIVGMIIFGAMNAIKP